MKDEIVKYLEDLPRDERREVVEELLEVVATLLDGERGGASLLSAKSCPECPLLRAGHG